MTEQTYDERRITDYLLGALPDAETARLDELSFTDDRFSAALDRIERDLLDAYARGELDAATREKVASCYFASPRKREKIEFAQAFQIFADNLAAHSVVAPAAEKQNAAETIGARRFARLAWLQSALFARPAWSFGFAAAALILALAGGWLFYENARLRSRLDETQAARAAAQERARELQNQLNERTSKDSDAEQELARARQELAELERRAGEERRAAEERARTQIARAEPPPAPAIASFELMPQTRGASSLPALRLPANAGRVRISLRLEANDFSRYRVALRDESANKIIWRSANLKPVVKGDGKILSLDLPARLLQTRIYALEVSGAASVGADEFLSGYPFRIVKRQTR